MDIAEILALKRQQVNEQKEVHSDSEIQKLASNSHNITLDFKSAASTGYPGIVAQLDNATGVTPAGVLEQRGHHYVKRDKVKAVAARPEGQFLDQQRQEMSKMREEVHVPLLFMDWIIDPYQIYVAQLAGADALTLTACIMDDNDAEVFTRKTHTCGMQVAMRCFTPQDVELGCSAGADIILADLRKQDGGFYGFDVLERLSAKIKGDAICVALAGVSNANEAREAYKSGAQGVIVDSVFMEQADVRRIIEELEKSRA